MNLLEKLLLVKEMIIQLVACKIILISKESYNMISIDLSKQQALDGDPREILQINITANLDRLWNTTMFFIIEEAKETVLDFSQGTVKVL